MKNICNFLTPNAEDVIERKEIVRDLGIMMNEKADFSDHINHICAKVNQKSGWIMRTFVRRDEYFLKFMWKTYMQGHIDYCSQLWQPLQSQLLQRLEGLQRAYTKKSPEMSNLSYWERLKILKLNSQQRRLERYRMIYVWKILEGLSPNCGIKHDTNDIRGRMCQVPPLVKNARQSIKTQREQTLQVHGVKLFNKLPWELRNMTSCSVVQFKGKLDKFLTGIPDQPLVGDMVPSTCNMITGRPSNSILDWIPHLHQDTRRRRPV